jgi:arginyl-tRNA synthetase
MQVDAREKIEEALKSAIRKEFPDLADPTPTLERPRNADHGDFATPEALTLAKRARQNPRQLAEIIAGAMGAALGDVVENVEVAGPGFINFRLSPAERRAIVPRVLQSGDRFGRRDAHRGERVIVEFVSANPTGPLHVGHGRQAALGDAIATLLEWQGYDVVREFYYNDAGAQIHNLALSVRARAHELLGEPAHFPEDGYHGEYIRELAQRYLDEVGKDLSDIESIRRFAVAALREEQDRDLQAFGVKFDRYYLESSLYTDGRVDATVARLAASGAMYEHEGALWLRTTDYGDDKDRVMRKSDGGYTYFVPDVAYHVTKFERGFAKAINIQGADHHSTITRVRAGLQALRAGIPPGYPDYVLHKMVTVMRGGEEVKISKRAGSYVTLRDLIDEVGRDAGALFPRIAEGRHGVRLRYRLSRARSREDNPSTTSYATCPRFALGVRQAGFRASMPRPCLEDPNSRRSQRLRERAMRRLADFLSEIAPQRAISPASQSRST